MMKQNIVTGLLPLLTGFIFHCSLLTAQPVQSEIPVTVHDGLGKGMAEYAMNGLSFVNWETYIWKDIIPEPEGIPENWTETRSGVEFLNQPQFIYQHVKAGQISADYMQDNWLENAEFTETPMRCYLLFAEGMDAEGNRRFVMDRNNNGNFSDDTCFYADSMTFEKGRKETRVMFDAYIKGKVEPQERTIYLGYNPHHQMYFGKIAEYATCYLDGTGYMLSPYGYNYMGYEDFEVLPLAGLSPDGQPAEQPVRKGEYLQVKNEWFRVKGVHVNRQVLTVEKENRQPSEVFALQTDFRPYPFTGTEFTSNDSLSLESYKGKTLLLMVFSPGCGSCIDKLAPMNEIYASVDPSEIAVLGLALHTDAAYMSSVKQEHAIAFPLLVGEYGQINDAYNRLNTPTFLLINP
ncbi:MAG: TlpA family protein disulfide reductase, partial [Tannerella sp.]|nr:TlpA family protein disulfide reductase [Tannerella sp.]